MTPRHPRCWLMTDERTGDALWDALERLPRGGGVVFRHYALGSRDRRALFEAVRAVARRRRLVLVLAASPRLAIAWRADGAHGPSPHRRASRPLLRTTPCHDQRALIEAQRRGVNYCFVSPLFPTRSHPGTMTLGPVRAGLMARERGGGLVALGGMTADRYRRVRTLGFDGWAAIDAWS